MNIQYRNCKIESRCNDEYIELMNRQYFVLMCLEMFHL
jgi:hypothetical protein